MHKAKTFDIVTGGRSASLTLHTACGKVECDLTDCLTVVACRAASILQLSCLLSRERVKHLGESVLNVDVSRERILCVERHLNARRATFDLRIANEAVVNGSGIGCAEESEHYQQPHVDDCTCGV